jgi:hypothetical protein
MFKTKRIDEKDKRKNLKGREVKSQGLEETQRWIAISNICAPIIFFSFNI